MKTGSWQLKQWSLLVLLESSFVWSYLVYIWLCTPSAKILQFSHWLSSASSQWYLWLWDMLYSEATWVLTSIGLLLSVYYRLFSASSLEFWQLFKWNNLEFESKQFCIVIWNIYYYHVNNDVFCLVFVHYHRCVSKISSIGQIMPWTHICQC